jgi:UDP-N-acetylmuramate--alanine ligase
VKALHSGSKLGGGEFMVAEGGRVRRLVLKMKPTIAVVTNIDREHLDHYKTSARSRTHSSGFFPASRSTVRAVVCLDEPNLRAILPRVDRKIVTYGLSSDADLVATDVVFDGFASSYVARWRGNKLGPVRIPVPGRHSVYNSLAAVAVGLELDVPFGKIAKSLARFQAVDRRFQWKGEAFGATVVDDYGHHPTEIQATLAAAREGFGARTVVAFQPHRYSRTRALLEEFGRAFVLADRVIVTAVYAAGEAAIPEVDGAAVADALVRHGHPAVSYEPRLERIPNRLKELVFRATSSSRSARGHLEGGRRVSASGARRRPVARPAARRAR